MTWPADKLVLIGLRSQGVKAWHLDTRRMVASVQLEPGPAAVTALASSPTDPTFAAATAAAASGACCARLVPRAAGHSRVFKLEGCSHTRGF